MPSPAPTRTPSWWKSLLNPRPEMSRDWRRHLLILLFGAALQAPAWSNCKFANTQAFPISFGSLQPQNAVALNQSRGLALSGNCGTGPLPVEVIGGTSRNMRSASGALLPYTATAARSGTGWVTLRLDIAAGSYADLPAGTYTDTVTVSFLW
jgi:hypothetical protein